MTLHLQPFGGVGPAVGLSAELTRSADNLLALSYTLTGSLETLVLPTPTSTPERRDELWKTTCLEFFLGIPGSPRYFEFNLSLSGDWNAYSFDGYRLGMTPIAALNALPFAVTETKETRTLTLSLSLDLIVSQSQPLEAALTAVIEEKSGAQSFWAVQHAPADADFHDRCGFVLSLP